MKTRLWIFMLTTNMLMLTNAASQALQPDRQYPLPPDSWPSPVMDDQVVSLFLLDRLEYRQQKRNNTQLWDAQASIGTDYNKLWLKSEGERTVGLGVEKADLQLLYARLVSPFWYLQTGARTESRPGPSRSYGVLAVQGLAPLWFNIEGSMFFRPGEVSARIEGEYEQRITQRLILQPRAEINVSGSSDRERRFGSGIRDVELGLRLRYEFAREIAPYIGVNWERKLGTTASFARQDGETVTSRGLVVGVRLWY